MGEEVGLRVERRRCVGSLRCDGLINRTETESETFWKLNECVFAYALDAQTLYTLMFDYVS